MYSHWPESSYSPAVAITASTSSTYLLSMHTLPVTGLVPPLASVAAIMARSLALTPTEHCRV